MTKMRLDMVVEPFIEGAARALFVDAWVTHEEEKAEASDGHVPWGPRAELMDEAPETPMCAYAEAGRLLERLEIDNKTSIYHLVKRAEEAEGTGIDVNNFGHYVAMQALGHGVSWFDDHEKFEIVIPHFQFNGQFEE